MEKMKKDLENSTTGTRIVLYTAAVYGYDENLKYYGYIIYGDGRPNHEITKDEYFDLLKKYGVGN